MKAIQRKTDPDSVPVFEWPDPMPLSAVIRKPEPYPIESLPKGLVDAVIDVQSTTQAPIAMVATSALTTLSLACQAHINVARDQYLIGPVSLFALVLAESGERKSTVDAFFTQAIKQYESVQTESLRLDVETYLADTQAWTAEKAGLLEKIKSETKSNNITDDLKEKLRYLEHTKPDAPKIPELMFGDATPEALTFTLANKWPSGGVISSEAGVVFGSHGMGTDSVMRNLAILNMLWSGESHKVNRRTSESFTIRNARLTVSLQVQYPVLAGFMAKQGDLARGSGFLARFLVAWPESTQGTRQYKEPNKVLSGLERYNSRITQLLTKQIQFDESGNGIQPVILEFSKEAKYAWIELHDLIEGQLRPLGELADVKDVASKTADNAARIAALFHIFENDSSATVSADHIIGAGKIALWHLNESSRLLTELGQDPALSHAARLDDWLIERCYQQNTGFISTRVILQYCPVKQLRKLSQLTPVLNELIEADRIHQVTDQKKKLIFVNPKLLRKETSWV